MNAAESAKAWLDAEIEADARWSDEQRDVFDWFACGSGNLLVRARAGCAKTTSLVEGVERAPDRSILLTAFNRSIADELQRRIRNTRVSAKTLHGLGYLYAKRMWKCTVDERRERARTLAYAACGGDAAPNDAVRLVALLHTKAREIDPWIETVDATVELMVRFDLLPSEDLERRGWTPAKVAEAALGAVDRAKERVVAIDYADMIFLPLVHGWVVPSYDLVAVDEAQDMSSSQLAMAVGACRRGGRVVALGDDRQVVYSFRGAEIDGLDRLKESLGAAELGLKTTYRCPKRVVELAQAIVPDFVAHASAPDGAVDVASTDRMVAEARPGDFVLSRKNAPLVRACVALLKRGTRARVKGSDFGKQTLALVDRMRASGVDDLASKVHAWARKELERAAKLPEDAAAERAAAVVDQRDLVDALLDGVDDLAAFVAKARELFDDAPTADAVTCSSIHRAKGLEADTVYVLASTLRSDRAEELNLQYVAFTRAKRRLVLVDGEIS